MTNPKDIAEKIAIAAEILRNPPQNIQGWWNNFQTLSPFDIRDPKFSELDPVRFAFYSGWSACINTLFKFSAKEDPEKFSEIVDSTTKECVQVFNETKDAHVKILSREKSEDTEK